MRKLTISSNVHEKGQSDHRRRYGVHYGTLFKHLKKVQTHSFDRFGKEELPIERFLEAVEEVPCRPGAITITRNHYATTAWGTKTDPTKAPLNRVVNEAGEMYVQASISEPWSGSSAKKIIKLNTHVQGEYLPFLEHVRRCNIDAYDTLSGVVRVFVYVLYKDNTHARVEAHEIDKKAVGMLGAQKISLDELKGDDTNSTKTIVFEYPSGGPTWSLPNKRPYDHNTIFRLTDAKTSLQYDLPNKAASAAFTAQDVCFVNRSSRASSRQCPTDVAFIPPINPGLSLASLAFEGALFDIQTHDNTIRTVQVRMDMCETLRADNSALNACFRLPRLVPLKGLNPPPQSDLKRARRLTLAKTPQPDAPTGLNWAVDGVFCGAGETNILVERAVVARTAGQKTLYFSTADWVALTKDGPQRFSRCKSVIVEVEKPHGYLRLTLVSHNVWKIEADVAVIKNNPNLAEQLKQCLFRSNEDTSSARYLDRRGAFTHAAFKTSVYPLMRGMAPDALVVVGAASASVCVRQDDAIDIGDIVRFRGPYIDRLSDVFSQTRSTCDTSVWKLPLKRRAEYMSHTRAVNTRDLSKQITFHAGSHVLIDGEEFRIDWNLKKMKRPDFAGTIIGVDAANGAAEPTTVTIRTMDNREKRVVNPMLLPGQRMTRCIVRDDSRDCQECHWLGEYRVDGTGEGAPRWRNVLSSQFVIERVGGVWFMRQGAHSYASNSDASDTLPLFGWVGTVDPLFGWVGTVAPYVQWPRCAFSLNDSLNKQVVFRNKYFVEINSRHREVRWPREAPSDNFSGHLVSFGSGSIEASETHSGKDDKKSMTSRQKLMVRSRLDGRINELDNPEVSVDPYDDRIFIFSLTRLGSSGIDLSEFMTNVTRATSDASSIDQRGVVTAEVVDYHGTPRVVVRHETTTSEPPFYIRLRRDRHSEANCLDVFCNIRIHSEPAVSLYVKAHDAPLSVSCRRLSKLKLLSDGKSVGVNVQCISEDDSSATHTWDDLTLAFPSGAVTVRPRGFDGTQSASVERSNGGEFNDAMAYGLRHEEDALLTLQDWLDTTRAALIVVKNPDLTFVRDSLSATPDGLVVSMPIRVTIDEKGHPYILNDCEWNISEEAGTKDRVQDIEPHWFVERVHSNLEANDGGAVVNALRQELLERFSANGPSTDRFSIPAVPRHPLLEKLEQAEDWWRDFVIEIHSPPHEKQKYKCRFAPRRVGVAQSVPTFFRWKKSEPQPPRSPILLAGGKTLKVHAFVEAKCHIGGRNMFRLSSGESYYQQLQTQQKVLGLETCFFTSWSSKQTCIFEIDAFELDPENKGVVLKPTQVVKSVVRQKPKLSKTRLRSTTYSVTPTTNTVRLSTTYSVTPTTNKVRLRTTAEADAYDEEADLFVFKKIDDGEDKSIEPAPVMQTPLPVTTYTSPLVIPIDPSYTLRERVAALIGAASASLRLRLESGELLTDDHLISIDRTVVHVTGDISGSVPSFDATVCRKTIQSWMQQRQRPPLLCVLCVVDYALLDIMHPKFYAYSDHGGVSHVLHEDSMHVWRRYGTLEDAGVANDVDRSMLVIHPSAPTPDLSATRIENGAWPDLRLIPTQMVHIRDHRCYVIGGTPETLLDRHMSTLRGMDAASFRKWSLWWTDFFTIIMLQTNSQLVTLSIDPTIASLNCTNAAIESAVMCGEMIADAGEAFTPVAHAQDSTQWMHEGSEPVGADHDAPTSSENMLLSAWASSNRATQFSAALEEELRVTTVVAFEHRLHKFVPVTDSLNSADYHMLRTIFRNKRRPRFEDRRLEDVVVSMLMRGYHTFS